MLIRFTVRNFKIFKEAVVLSLIASKYYKDDIAENIIEAQTFGLQLLKSAVIYGANASGKTKLVEAMGFMRRFVLYSFKDTQQGDKIPIQPFLLSTETEHAPTEFEIIFIHDGVMYRYGFEVTVDKVVAEWLFYREKRKEVELFYRDGQDVDIHTRNFKVGEMLLKNDLVRDNALMLSVAAQFNDKKAGKVIDWFKKLRTMSGLKEDGHQAFTMEKTKDSKAREDIIKMLQVADMGIDDLDLKPLDVYSIPKNLPREFREIIERASAEGRDVYTDVLTTHKKYNAQNAAVGRVQFSLDKDESSGTKKFFALTGPVLDTIQQGNILVVDELDSKLHPNLVGALIEIFNSKAHNPLNAQLIFNTHDTNLLNAGIFRRDQIWFTEKDRYGAATLFSLADFKNVRKEENFERNYIQGKYGAIPYLGEFEELFAAEPMTAYEKKR